MVLLAITVALSFSQTIVYFTSGRNLCLFAVTIFSMMSCFLTFLMAMILVFSFLKSANQIYVFSLEGRLPTHKEEHKINLSFYIIAFLAVASALSYISLSLIFYESENGTALKDTYQISACVAGVFSLYLAFAYTKTLYLLNKTVAKREKSGG
jgi:hypothetical protein